MGRKRTKFCNEKDKILGCSICGKEHRVSGDAVEVACDICILGCKVADHNTPIPEPTKPKELKEENKPIAKTIVKDSSPKKGRGRPRKNPNLSVDKKGSEMVEKKMDVKNGTGKRGRKATVGSAVLSYIKGKTGEVMFTDILNVYSSEREKLGKKSTPEVEMRNCRSTLYVLQKDGRIAEVAKKMTYKAI